MKPWTWCTPLACLLLSCGGARLGGSSDIRVEQATGVAQCKVSKDVERPMLVEWPAVEKAALQTRTAKGVVVVSYDGCSLKPLDRCQLEGPYEFMETARAKDGFAIRNKSDLFAKLPLGAVSLEGELKQGTSLELSYVAVGTKTAQLEDDQEALPERCAGASHYIQSMVVGAYALTAEKTAGGGAAVEVGPAGAGGRHEKESATIRSDGDLERCAVPATAADSPSCQAVVQLVLVPLPSELRPPGADTAPVLEIGGIEDGSAGDDRGGTARALAWAGGAGALATGVVAGVMWGMTSARADDFESYRDDYRALDPESPDDAARESDLWGKMNTAHDDAERYNRVAVGFTVASGVLLGGVIVVLLASGSGDEGEGEETVSVVAAPGGVGMTF